MYSALLTVLSGHVLNCYGKSGEGNLVGGTAASIGTGGLLTEAQMKDSKSYVGWEFGTDWKISEDGLPERWRIRRLLHWR